MIESESKTQNREGIGVLNNQMTLCITTPQQSDTARETATPAQDI